MDSRFNIRGISIFVSKKTNEYVNTSISSVYIPIRKHNLISQTIVLFWMENVSSD